jgi:probable F420-dependent oxidoreductase
MTNAAGRFGIWAHGSNLTPETAVELERLGFETLWVGGSPNGDLAIVGELLDATDQVTVATGVVNIWADPAEQVAASFHRIQQGHPGRFLLGIGVGHPEARSDYTRPYEALERYLDVLDEEEVPPSRRLLAALGPRVLRLAADRTAGAHPYLTTPAHTRQARDLLGPDRLLAPEHKVVLDTDIDRARALGRAKVANPYLGLTNYTNNLRRLGFDDTDFADGGSDRLVDALVAHGDAQTVADRLTEHLDAGADHVAIQLLTAPGADPLDGYRQLAAALFASDD